MTSRYDADRAEVAAILAGEPRYRVDQVWHGLYEELADPGELTSLPAALRTRLGSALPAALQPVAEQTSDGGETVKWLWALEDGTQVETVLMHYADRSTVCASTQAGCAMGCGFCATGQAGFDRHLTRGEIVEQVVRAARRARADGRRLSNVVFMGMGEPLANYDPMWAATLRLHEDLGLSARHLTVSTVGIVPGIRRLATEDLPVNLAVSLHAADDALRDELVPINRRYPLSTLLDACAGYLQAKGRRLSFEWALIDGVNDRDVDARRLIERARSLPLPAHVNLIPLNPTPGYAVRGTPPRRVRAFRDLLRAGGVNATVRRTRGTDIDAACGQLRGGAHRRGDRVAVELGSAAAHEDRAARRVADRVHEPLPRAHLGARPHHRAHHVAADVGARRHRALAVARREVRRQVPVRGAAVDERTVVAHHLDPAGRRSRLPARLVQPRGDRLEGADVGPRDDGRGHAAGRLELVGPGEEEADALAVPPLEQRRHGGGAPGVCVHDHRRAPVEPSPQVAERARPCPAAGPPPPSSAPGPPGAPRGRPGGGGRSPPPRRRSRPAARAPGRRAGRSRPGTAPWGARG